MRELEGVTGVLQRIPGCKAERRSRCNVSRGQITLLPKAGAVLRISTSILQGTSLNMPASWVTTVVRPGLIIPCAVQPSNVSDGLRQAADKLSAGFGEMGEALRAPFRSPGSGEGNSPEQLPSGGVGAAAVRALRAAPGAIAKPLSEGAAAARCALLGARNSLDPDRLQERRLAN